MLIDDLKYQIAGIHTADGGQPQDNLELTAITVISEIEQVIEEIKVHENSSDAISIALLSNKK